MHAVHKDALSMEFQQINRQCICTNSQRYSYTRVLRPITPTLASVGSSPHQRVYNESNACGVRSCRGLIKLGASILASYADFMAQFSGVILHGESTSRMRLHCCLRGATVAPSSTLVVLVEISQSLDFLKCKLEDAFLHVPECKLRIRGMRQLMRSGLRCMCALVTDALTLQQTSLMPLGCCAWWLQLVSRGISPAWLHCHTTSHVPQLGTIASLRGLRKEHRDTQICYCKYRRKNSSSRSCLCIGAVKVCVRHTTQLVQQLTASPRRTAGRDEKVFAYILELVSNPIANLLKVVIKKTDGVTPVQHLLISSHSRTHLPRDQALSLPFKQSHACLYGTVNAMVINRFLLFCTRKMFNASIPPTLSILSHLFLAFATYI